MEPAGLRFVAAGLATWRVAHLLTGEDGPADSVVRLRRRIGDGPLAELADCFLCTSVWVAAPFAFWVARRRCDRLVVWLGISGLACLAELLARDDAPAAVLEFDDERGASDGLLRSR